MELDVLSADACKVYFQMPCCCFYLVHCFIALCFELCTVLWGPAQSCGILLLVFFPLCYVTYSHTLQAEHTNESYTSLGTVVVVKWILLGGQWYTTPTKQVRAETFPEQSQRHKWKRSNSDRSEKRKREQQMWKPWLCQLVHVFIHGSETCAWVIKRIYILLLLSPKTCRACWNSCTTRSRSWWRQPSHLIVLSSDDPPASYTAFSIHSSGQESITHICISI